MRLRAAVGVWLALLLAGMAHAQGIEGKSMQVTSGEIRAKVVLASAQPVRATQATPSAPSASGKTPSQPASVKASSQPDLTTIKADFVPGEKTLFFDDFSDMAGDEPPPHWKVRGGAVALKVGSGIRQLEIMGDRLSLTPMIKGLPKNFTLETEMKFDNADGANLTWYFHDKTWDGPNGPYAALSILTQTREDGVGIFVRHNTAAGPEDIASVSAKADLSQVVKQAIWVQNGRLRVYVNGERVVDVNQVEMPPLTGAEFDPEFGASKFGFRTVRFGESIPDFSQVITSAGRYVTHGIYFDTDSDKLKPESAAVIKQVSAGLQKNPALKVRIEGHTDSTGTSEHNLDLSKRRAEAVKTVLVSQFGIEEARLTTAGLGGTKPIDSNDTPQGRAQNRRVEFVRQ